MIRHLLGPMCLQGYNCVISIVIITNIHHQPERTDKKVALKMSLFSFWTVFIMKKDHSWQCSLINIQPHCKMAIKDGPKLNV